MLFTIFFIGYCCCCCCWLELLLAFESINPSHRYVFFRLHAIRGYFKFIAGCAERCLYTLCVPWMRFNVYVYAVVIVAGYILLFSSLLTILLLLFHSIHLCVCSSTQSTMFHMTDFCEYIQWWCVGHILYHHRSRPHLNTLIQYYLLYSFVSFRFGCMHLMWLLICHNFPCNFAILSHLIHYCDSFY